MNDLSKYKEVRGQMEAGDILLFSGKGVISKLIQIGTGSKWSHVGLVCPMTYMGSTLVLIWESTTLSNVPDFETGKPHKGVQLVDLSTRLAQYDGAVAWRSVKATLLPGERKNLLFRARERMKGVPYEESNFELIRSAIDTIDLFSQQPDASSLFCSEMAAYAYQDLGWLPTDLSPNEVTPADFAGNDLPFQRIEKISDPIEIIK